MEKEKTMRKKTEKKKYIYKIEYFFAILKPISYAIYMFHNIFLHKKQHKTCTSHKLTIPLLSKMEKSYSIIQQ